MIQMKVFETRAEWLEGRKQYIGGSDASAVIGLNPWKTNIQLWNEKTGKTIPEDISDKPYVLYGNQAEHYLRELFALDFPQYKVHYKENNMFLNSDYPWGHYSADGWLTDSNGRLGILEIKTTNILQSMQKEKWNNRIPDNYYTQLLHGFLITGAEFAVLKAQLKTVFGGVPYLQTKHYFLEREDVKADLEYLARSEEEFWGYIQSGKQPPLMLPNI